MTEQNNMQLPKDWKILSLSETIQKIESGKRPKGGVQNITEGIPSIGGEHLDSNGNFKFEKIKYVPVEFAQSMLKGRIQENDILVVKDGATTGKVSFVGKNFSYKNAVINEHVFLLRLRSEILPKYVFYKLWSQKGNQEILQDFRGAAQGGISTNFINLVEIPLPPLPEQHRIVAKIEELFSEIDKAVENLQTARQQLKTYRQSVLKHAFEGKLTAGWRESLKFKDQSLKLAAEPESVYQTKNGLPEGWEWKELGTFISKITAGKSVKCIERPPIADELGIVKVSAVSWGNFKEEESKTTDYSKYIENYIIKKNDFLFSRANTIELVGACVIVNNISLSLMLSDKILRFDFQDLSKKYALFYLRSPIGRKNIEDLATGNQDSMRNISQASINRINIPFCPINEQLQIVAEIEKRFSEADKLEESIETALRQTEALRQSILKKAFAGKLVGQDENKAGE